MTTYILIIVVVIVVIGALRAMTKEERATVIKGGINTAKVAGSYGLVVTKETAKLSYNSGTWLGNEVSLNQQESLNAIKSFNEEMGRLGAARTGKATATEHLDFIGVVGANKSLDEAIKAQAAELAKLRA